MYLLLCWLNIFIRVLYFTVWNKILYYSSSSRRYIYIIVVVGNGCHCWWVNLKIIWRKKIKYLRFNILCQISRLRQTSHNILWLKCSVSCFWRDKPPYMFGSEWMISLAFFMWIWIYIFQTIFSSEESTSEFQESWDKFIYFIFMSAFF